MSIQRRTTRKLGYDYSSAGFYFVTIVVKHRRCCLASITNGGLQLSALGSIVKSCWSELTADNPYAFSEAFVIMPNHVHFILKLEEKSTLMPGRSSRSLGEYIRKLKARSSVLIRRKCEKDFEWQRNYYDHVIRTEKEFTVMRLYVLTNPLLWDTDVENPQKKEIKGTEQDSLMKECGFSNDDVELITNYIEFRTRKWKENTL
jgi:putative transposase